MATTVVATAANTAASPTVIATAVATAPTTVANQAAASSSLLVPAGDLELQQPVGESALTDVLKQARKLRAPTVARWCRAHGDGLQSSGIMEAASFTIDAHDFTGARQHSGGDNFFVGIRCNAQGTRVRSRVADNADGTYTVVYKPPIAGKYTIAISLLGEPLPGSPFACFVSTPAPRAENCILQGDALTKAVSRKNESFRISFRDALGRVAHAEELDVYVVREGSPRSCARLP